MPRPSSFIFSAKRFTRLALALTIMLLCGVVSVSTVCPTSVFRESGSYTVGASQPRAIAIEDYNGDGQSDLAVANATSNNISILLNLGGGVYGAPIFVNAGTTPTAIVSKDFNNDGKRDLAVVNRNISSTARRRFSSPPET
ncbi:MAG: hypothetical protein AUG75_17575 [Cyanobacteria bacterium 13_1_20CM_4_61_6]|nr:MAG: hypothetical protein AUG75_17575 [Cyanobacteria bacterium 13_1_20CM_4_61_6]